MEELYTTWKAIGVAGGDLSFFQDFFVKFYQAFIEGDRWLQYLNGVKTTLLVTALALILGHAPHRPRPAAPRSPQPHFGGAESDL